MISRSQLFACGLSRRALEHRLRRGRLHPVRRGVYAVGRAELNEHGRLMAVVLACGPGAVLSHGSAAELWGLAAEARGLSRGDAPEVTVLGGRRRRPDGIRVHRRALSAREVTERRSIPVTTPARTLLDLATQLSDDRLEAAIVAADRLDLISVERLRDCLADLTGRHGVAALRRVLDRRSFTITDSELERHLLRLARRAGLPLPETGARAHGYRLDFLWRDLGLVVETDGLRYHRTPADQARDRRRDQVLTERGLTVLRFTYEQVTRWPGEVERTLLAVAGRLRDRQDLSR